MSIKISGGIQENGIVIGNIYDKYSSRNPIVKWMMKGFKSTLSDFVAQTNAKSIHEIGCGEGYWVLRWNRQGIAARGSDFSRDIIKIAQENSIFQDLPPTVFETRNIYDLDAKKDNADLIVCCEVLEHLKYPEEGLKALQRITQQYLIVSVPREPLWRILNLTRGKYITSLGNTPGHIQHWTKNNFIKLVSRYFDIIEIQNPLPWTMILCRARS